MRPLPTPHALLPWTLFAFIAALAGPVRAEAPDSPARPADLACDYGIHLAFTSHLDEAEAMFVDILSRHPEDTRGLTNLGNVSLLRGAIPLALAYYGRAAACDTTDAGIALNICTARMLLGDESGALDCAVLATRRAGGATQAAQLIGLRELPADTLTSRGDGLRHLATWEIAQLLRRAGTAAPRRPGAIRPAAAGAPAQTQPSGAGASSRQPDWRTAGVRGGITESAQYLYWKR
jgi:hypothetical protein